MTAIHAALAEHQRDSVEAAPRMTTSVRCTEGHDLIEGYDGVWKEIDLGPDPDYSCGAAYCDDPACNTHGPKGRDE